MNLKEISTKMAMTPDKLKAMFNDLGKATKRGVRKCPNCGTINGTRGMTCKNRECEFVFKEGSKKTSSSNSKLRNAVKVVTGSPVQVFSVRLHDRGPDYRGFVQLPLIQDLDGNPAENVDPAIMMRVLSTAAKCYVENCPRAKLNDESVPVCVHIKSSKHCTEEAQPLTLKNSVLNALEVAADIKEAIWFLATETSGPLVQRATKNIFIVKCKPCGRHPLGFLHFAFFALSKGKESNKSVDNKFVCTCKQYKSHPKPVLPNEENHKKCIHFYACVCAFASDDALAQEFSYFISLAQFTDILPDSIETTVVFGGNSAPNIIIKGTPENVESTITQFETLGGDSVVTEFNAQPVEQQIEEEELETDGVHSELPDNFEDTEEDIVTDVDDITGHEKMVDPGGLGIKGIEGQPLINVSTVSNVPLVNITSIDQTSKLDSCTVNITPIEDHHSYMNIEQSGTEDPSGSLQNHMDNFDNIEVDNNIEVIIDDNHIVSVSEPQAKRSRMDENLVFVSEPADTIVQASSALLTLQEATAATNIVQTTVVTDSKSSAVASAPSAEYRIIPKKHTPIKPATVKQVTVRKVPNDETSLQISFHQWLGSVTERINQTMHYQFDGVPEPLVFHAPQIFFDCLQARISAGSKKKRLPNSTTGFIRRDALPLGTFTKYTWHITNILHVKQIFDSPDMHLDVTRSFIENKDGTFDLYDKQKAEAVSQGDGKNQYLPIRPFELKTYLKVGHTSPTQKDATPFIIEWIPDILPKSRIGELRIKFEYGHQRNGQMENRSQSQTQS